MPRNMTQCISADQVKKVLFLSIVLLLRLEHHNYDERDIGLRCGECQLLCIPNRRSYAPGDVKVRIVQILPLMKWTGLLAWKPTTEQILTFLLDNIPLSK
jgi:hypothetical protein